MMKPEDQLTILYHALVKAKNALFIYKFSNATLSLNNNLKTFKVLMIDSYYSLYANLSFIFDGQKAVMNLSKILNIKNGIAENDRTSNLQLYKDLVKKHKSVITKIETIRNNAVSHINKNYEELDLVQYSGDIQGLIDDLLALFNSIQGIDIDVNSTLIWDRADKIRDDLGQRDLWNNAILNNKLPFDL